jgi:hypothetical protein
MQQDSIISGHIGTASFDTVPSHPARPQTPYQVLRLLPKDATPAQQDSAIQAWFQPGEVHYSEQPDTLHLPGHDIPRDLKDVNLPQYYRESFFSKDTLLHPELEAGRYGVVGDPIPYVIGNDNVISSLLIISFVIAMLTISMCRNFIFRQFKDFIYVPKAENIHHATSNEFNALTFFSTLTVLMLSLLYFFYVKTYVADTFILTDEYILIGIIFGIILGYFLIKVISYTLVNLTFFEGKKNRQWMEVYVFLTVVEGILLFPSVLLLSYFDIDAKYIAYYFIFVLILVKIGTFYKSFIIFFKQNVLYLQIILYFCALEIIPLLALWGGLRFLINYLKINF